MIVNPNKDFSFISEILNLKTEAQFTIDLILKHFNGRIIGKIDRKGWDYNKIKKVKRGLSELMNQGLIARTGYKGVYILNPYKFIFKGEKASYNSHNFLFGLWIELHWGSYQQRITNRLDLPILKALAYIWKTMPEATCQYNKYLTSLLHEYELLNEKNGWKNWLFYEPSIVRNASKYGVIPYERELTESEMFDTCHHFIVDQYSAQVQEREMYDKTIQDILKGTFKKKYMNLHEEFDYVAYCGYKLAHQYFYEHYPECLEYYGN